jgi:putative ABC transport system permease protein
LRTVLITAAPGTSVNELRAAVSSIADRFGGDVQDAGQLASATSQGLDTLLGVVYVLLALAILVALLGIANALSLAVHERRREIGLLRAVGQTRRQVRQVLRLEALMVAAFGTVTGIVLGSFLGWSLFGAVSTSQGFTLPVGRLLIVAVVGAVAGAAAARRPAKRAARVPILDAIAMP